VYDSGTPRAQQPHGRAQPAAGYAARILTLIGAAALASIFVAEMLIGRLVTDGGDTAAATHLLDITLSGPMVAAVIPGLLAFFVGIGVFAVPLLKAGGKPARDSGALFPRSPADSGRDPLCPGPSQSNRKHPDLLWGHSDGLADPSGGDSSWLLRDLTTSGPTDKDGR
jgi:hypothetical protein